MQELTPEQQAAIEAAEAERRRQAMTTLDGTVATVEGQLEIARAADDAKSAEKLERSLAKLRQKKMELESDARPA